MASMSGREECFDYENELAEKEEELRIEIEYRDQEIEELKKQIKALQNDKNTVVQQIQELDDKIKQLEKENEKLKTEHAELNRQIQELTLRNEKTEAELTKTKTEMKEQVQKLHEEIYNSREKELVSEEDKALKATLYLGQMCWVIQALMYKYVLPSLYKPRKSYKVGYILEDISKLKPKSKRDEAKEKWEELEGKLNWKNEYTRAIDSIQEKRNIQSHPSLDESQLQDYIMFLDGKGMLEDWMTLQEANELKGILATLGTLVDPDPADHLTTERRHLTNYKDGSCATSKRRLRCKSKYKEGVNIL